METTIYTNGKSLFTLANYGKTAGVCHVNGISIHKEVSNFEKRAMHSNGTLFYIFGTGDRKVLANVFLNKKMKFKEFEIY